MKGWQGEWKDYFAREIAAWGRRSRALAAEGRGDEARFAQIRGNVFGIFQAVLAAAEKGGGAGLCPGAGGTDPGAVEGGLGGGQRPGRRRGHAH